MIIPLSVFPRTELEELAYGNEVHLLALDTITEEICELDSFSIQNVFDALDYKLSELGFKNACARWDNRVALDELNRLLA